MSCDVGKATEGLENELWCRWSELCSFSNLPVTSPTPQLILQPFHCFTYVTAHFPTLPLLHLHHSSFSNPSFISPTSQALHLIHLPMAAYSLTNTKRIVLKQIWAHGVTDTRTRDPSGGRRAPNRLRHEAALTNFITTNIHSLYDKHLIVLFTSNCKYRSVPHYCPNTLSNTWISLLQCVPNVVEG